MQDDRYADGVARLLEPGERLQTVALAGVANGAAPPHPPDAGPPSAETAGRPGFLGVLLNLISPTVVFSRAERLTDLIFYGVAGRGTPGSQASRLHHARWQWTVRERELRDTVLAVTDQRLLVCVTGPFKVWSKRDEGAEIAGMETVWSVPRKGIARARVGWHRLNPQRLRIDFADGSWLAFTVPLAESGQPLRSIAAALKS